MLLSYFSLSTVACLAILLPASYSLELDGEQNDLLMVEEPTLQNSSISRSDGGGMDEIGNETDS